MPDNAAAQADIEAIAPTCLVVGDVLLYRNGLAAGLAALEEVDVLGSCGSDEAIQEVGRLRPMVVVLDITHHEILDQLRALTMGATIHFVGFGIHNRDDAIRCAEAGISAFVGRDETIEDLNKTVLKAVRGEAVCSPKMMAGLVRHLAALTSNHKPQEIGCLTMRESEVATLVKEGLSNKEIAKLLCISPATVKNHVHMILEKFNVRRRGVIGRHI
ncbi:LuxR C-terminal-related transcriptional regulator [Parasphingorhabdus sp.]|uniref:LuxR C-terminal-related transcriptional regulator n=1 Tax=Parasphingorhabdus sp. TaxID=2709688 RepID=UPI003C760C3B